MTKEKIEKVVGRIGQEIYICEYIFEGDIGSGAVGTVMIPISEDIYDERMSISYIMDNYDLLWREIVEHGETELGLKEWAEEAYRYDGEEMVFDLSYYEYWDKIRELGYPEEKYPVIECVGGGRCFRPDMEWDEIYDRELWNKIVGVEKDDIIFEEVQITLTLSPDDIETLRGIDREMDKSGIIEHILIEARERKKLK